MAKQKKTAFEWAARSAIQKAIRRSDGPMLEQAFDVLWKIEPSWLFWRMPVLAAEEVPQLLGEMCDAARTASKMRAQDAKRAREIAFDLLHKVCSFRKDKTTWALTAFAYNKTLRGFKAPDTMTQEQTKRWNACIMAMDMIKNGREAALWKLLLEKAQDKPEAIRCIVRGAHGRFLAGGMEFDKILMAVTSIVALSEYGEDCAEAMREDLVPLTPARSGDWPWYCYDMHNLIGKRALSYVCKKYGFVKEEFSDQWFFYESNVVARGGFSVGFWFEAYRKEFDTYHKTSFDLWNASRVRQDLSELIPRFVESEGR